MVNAHPELVHRVVLADPAPLHALLPPTPQAMAEADKRRAFASTAMERLQQGDSEGGLKRFIAGVLAPGAWQKMLEPQKQMIRDNMWSIKSLLTDAKEPFTCADVGKITMLVLLVAGENSPRPYGVMMEALTPYLKQHAHVTIPKEAHPMNRAIPEAFNAAVLEFLAEHWTSVVGGRHSATESGTLAGQPHAGDGLKRPLVPRSHSSPRHLAPELLNGASPLRGCSCRAIGAIVFAPSLTSTTFRPPVSRVPSNKESADRHKEVRD